MWSGYRRPGICLRCFWVVFVVGCALYITEPALFSRIKKGLMLNNNNNNNAHSCPPCTCDCPPSLSLMNIAPGLVNLTITECGKDDPELNKEMEKQFVDRLTDELKLHKAVTEEHAHHMNMTYIAARRVASQYQKEAEKCNTATETCEEAREKIEALLIKERKKTSAWEGRARKLGWEAS